LTDSGRLARGLPGWF